MHRGWSHYIDLLRDDLWTNHHNIHIVDFDFYSLEIFNRCENSNDILIAIENWKTVHPLLKILPVDWNYTIPFGILHAPEPQNCAAILTGDSCCHGIITKYLVLTFGFILHK